MEVHSSESEGRRNQGGTRDIRAADHTVAHLLRVKRFAIKDQLGVKLSRAPTVEHRPNGGLSRVQQGGDGAEIRCQRDNCAHIQITIGPTIQAMTHTTRVRIRLNDPCTNLQHIQ